MRGFLKERVSKVVLDGAGILALALALVVLSAYSKHTSEMHNNAVPTDSNEPIKIEINSLSQGMQPLDKLTRESIFQLRKSRVSEYAISNIFSNDYEPDSSIYGNIDENADWVHDTQFFILNPYLLVLESGGNYVNAFLPYCGVDHVDYAGNNIVVNYKGSSAQRWFYYVFDYYPDCKGVIRLWLVNAYDAGFKFAHVDMSRSENIAPLPGASADSITQGIYSGREFYHFGHLSKNNISVDDPRAKLEVGQKNVRTRIYIKLWRTRPSSPDDNADMTYIIEVRPSIKN